MYPLRIKILSWLSASTLCVFSPLAYGNDYWDIYSKNNVPIASEEMKLTQFRSFVDYSDKMLVLQMSDGMGEITVPVNDQIVANLRLDLPEMQEVYDLLRQERDEEALDKMRPMIYPLIKFHEVPSGFYDLHGPLQQMLDTLLKVERFEELDFIYEKMDLSQSIIEYSQRAVQLMLKYQDYGMGERAQNIALMLPVDGIYKENMRAIATLADNLRAQGDFEAVIPIYRRILLLNPEQQGGETSIWLAYCLVLAGNLEEAEMLIGTIKQPNSLTAQFSLYQLLKGSLQYRQGNFGNALDMLTKGFVRAQPSYAWMAELLFLIGDCYRYAERFEAARSAWRDVILLYPNSPWADKARTSLESLPPPPKTDSDKNTPST